MIHSLLGLLQLISWAIKSLSFTWDNWICPPPSRRQISVYTFSVFRWALRNISGLILAVCVHCSVSVPPSFVCYSNKLFFENLHRTMRSPENYFSKATVFVRRCGTSHQSTLSGAGHVSCLKHFPYPEILLSVGVLLFVSTLPFGYTHW